MKRALLSVVIFFLAAQASFAMTCPQAEAAFFKQYESKSFAKNKEQFMSDPLRWKVVAERYMQAVMLVQADSMSPKSQTEFLVNGEVLDCWWPESPIENGELAAFVGWFNQQLPSERRADFAAKVRSMK